MAELSGHLVLAEDLMVVRVASLPGEIRRALDAPDEAAVLTRAGSRGSSQLIDSDGAELLSQFTTPRRLVDVVIEYCRPRQLDPRETLIAAFPLFQQLASDGVLVEAGAKLPQRQPRLAGDDRFAGFRIVRCIQLLDDTEVYEAEDTDGSPAALKLAGDAGTESASLLAREATVLKRLGGTIAPALLRNGEGWIASEWIQGVDVARAAADLRGGGAEGRQVLLALLAAVATTYATLHRRGILHGDVHPGNLIVGPDRRVVLVDFGHAVIRGSRGLDPRAGVAFYLEPEHAGSIIAATPPPRATPRGEQYSVAAVLYELWTGHPYLDFKLDAEQFARQVISEQPVPFASRGAPSEPRLEAALRRALAKDPRQRFSSMAALAAHVRSVAARPARRRESPRVGQQWLEGSLATLKTPEAVTAALTQPFAASVYHGLAGTSWAWLHLAVVRDDAMALAEADVCCAEAENASARPDTASSRLGRISPWHTGTGIAMVRARIAATMADDSGVARAIRRFAAASASATKDVDLTLGRAGTVLAAALLISRMPLDEKTRGALERLGDRAADELILRLRRLGGPARGRQTNLGLAHGWAGMCYALVRWRMVRRQDPLGPVSLWLEELAAQAITVGRALKWPWRDSGEALGTMPGWCNGTTGMVLLWILVHSVDPDERWLRLAQGAGYDVWSAVPAGWDLCCGLAGQALGTLALYRYTGEPVWHRRAGTLVKRAIGARRDSGSSDRPWSLYRGDFGIAVAAAGVERPELGGFPFVEIL